MKIILASTSPRRKELLSAAGLRFIIQAPTADETPLRGESPRKMVGRLAREKAISVHEMCRPASTPTLIIAADTIVVAPNGKTVFGKPRNAKEAERMLGTLGGQTHTVLTAYCMIAFTKTSFEECRRIVTSRVTMRKLTAAQLKAYIKTGEPMDKAGAYAAQGIGQALIDSIRGSYTNVVGLPLSHLLKDMEEHFSLGLFLK